MTSSVCPASVPARGCSGQGPVSWIKGPGPAVSTSSGPVTAPSCPPVPLVSQHLCHPWPQLHPSPHHLAFRCSKAESVSYFPWLPGSAGRPSTRPVQAAAAGCPSHPQGYPICPRPGSGLANEGAGRDPGRTLGRAQWVLSAAGLQGLQLSAAPCPRQTHCCPSCWGISRCLALHCPTSDPWGVTIMPGDPRV